MNSNRKKVKSKKKSKKNQLGSSLTQLSILTHNVGGQTVETEDGNVFLNPSRGKIVNNKEILNTIFSNPHSYYEKVDLICFQEYLQIGESIGPRQTNLAIADKNKGIIDISPKIQDRIQIYPTNYLCNGKQIIVVNFHGKIISSTSSFNQISMCIILLKELLNLQNQYDNLIIAGDFNFDLLDSNYINNCYHEMINTKKKGDARLKILDNLDYFKESLEIIINSIRNNFTIVRPTRPTNTWTLNYSGIKNQTIVDQCLISNKFRGIKLVEYSLLESYMADEIKPTRFLVDDFDHAPLKTVLHFYEPLTLI